VPRHGRTHSTGPTAMPPHRFGFLAGHRSAGSRERLARIYDVGRDRDSGEHGGVFVKGIAGRVITKTASAPHPHRTRTEAAMIAIPTVMKPTVTTVSCQAERRWPPGNRGRLAHQYCRQRGDGPIDVGAVHALQDAPAFSGAKSLTSAQIAPTRREKSRS